MGADVSPYIHGPTASLRLRGAPNPFLENRDINDQKGQVCGLGVVGKGPIGGMAAAWYLATMNLIVLVLILFLLFGGGGFYFGGPIIGGSGLGLVLLICLIIYFMGGFRAKA